jgi:hypothetical protein
MSITDEPRDLQRYTEKCAQRAAITAHRNTERAAEARAGGGRMSESDDDMEITGSRKNGKAARNLVLGEWLRDDELRRRLIGVVDSQLEIKAEETGHRLQ